MPVEDIRMRERSEIMNSKRVVEVFSAGCAICEETLNLVRRVGVPPAQVTLRDMHDHRSTPRQRRARHPFGACGRY